MTLQKAIEIQSESAWHGSTTFDSDFKDSQKLLIEAGKLVKKLQWLSSTPGDFVLPGETKE